ncbi:hypothetical protein Agub_g8521, partial [Astrephomene gubernaculifera]
SLDTSACLAGWPLLPMPPAVRWYYCCELAWYLQLLVKHHLGVGLPDNKLMVVHHATSIYLILMSYCFSIHRPGVLMLALLNSSTPLLHISKTAHHTGSRRVALASFAAFTAVFAASRVVLFPLIFLPLGLVHSRRLIPRVLQHYPLTFAIVNGLVAVLVAMQWMWFGAILRILRQAARGDTARLKASAQSMERPMGHIPAHNHHHQGGVRGSGDDDKRCCAAATAAMTDCNADVTGAATAAAAGDVAITANGAVGDGHVFVSLHHRHRHRQPPTVWGREDGGYEVAPLGAHLRSGPACAAA